MAMTIEQKKAISLAVLFAAMRIETVMQELRDSGAPATEEQRQTVKEAREYYAGLEYYQIEAAEKAALEELRKPYAAMLLAGYTRAQRAILADTCRDNIKLSCQACPAHDDCSVIGRKFRETEGREFFFNGMKF